MQTPLARWLRLGATTLLVLAGCGGDDSTRPDDGDHFQPPDTLDLVRPEGFPRFQVPTDNPLTVQGVALGRRLFYDPILSRDQSQSCGSCHAQEFAFSDHGRQFSVGIHGEEGTRNAPAIVNPLWLPSAFWDGRAPSIEDQARGPVPNPIEMDLPWEEAIPRLQAHDDYPRLFGEAFGTTEITEDRVVQAIAQFERTFISANSKYDRSLRGEVELTPSEQRGLQLFFTEEGDCFHCHGNILFTTGQFHDIGLDLTYADPGRQAVTGAEIDRGRFKTPSLRNVEHTAPYMHDGRFATLEEAVRHYESGIQLSPNLDPLILARVDRTGETRLDDEDIQALVDFLRTLSDPDFLTNPAFSNPFE